MHVPTVPASAQDRQVPVHAVAQQKPCAHAPELHSASAPQAAPMAFLPQLPALHTFGLAQSALVVHAVLHAAVAAGERVAAELVAVWQVPVPLQARAEVSIVPVQLAAAHWSRRRTGGKRRCRCRTRRCRTRRRRLSVHWFSGS